MFCKELLSQSRHALARGQQSCWTSGMKLANTKAPAWERVGPRPRRLLKCPPVHCDFNKSSRPVDRFLGIGAFAVASAAGPPRPRPPPTAATGALPLRGTPCPCHTQPSGHFTTWRHRVRVLLCTPASLASN